MPFFCEKLLFSTNMLDWSQNCMKTPYTLYRSLISTISADFKKAPAADFMRRQIFQKGTPPAKTRYYRGITAGITDITVGITAVLPTLPRYYRYYRGNTGITAAIPRYCRRHYRYYRNSENTGNTGIFLCRYYRYFDLKYRY